MVCRHEGAPRREQDHDAFSPLTWTGETGIMSYQRYHSRLSRQSQAMQSAQIKGLMDEAIGVACSPRENTCGLGCEWGREAFPGEEANSSNGSQRRNPPCPQK